MRLVRVVPVLAFLALAALSGCDGCGGADPAPSAAPGSGEGSATVQGLEPGVERSAPASVAADETDARPRPTERSLGPVRGLFAALGPESASCTAESRDTVWTARYIDGLPVEVDVNPRSGLGKQRHVLRWSGEGRIMAWEHTTDRGEPTEAVTTTTYRYDADGWLAEWTTDGATVRCGKDGRDLFACEGDAWSGELREDTRGWPQDAVVTIEGEPSTAYEYTYDDDRLSGVEQKVGDVARTIRFAYDTEGRVRYRESRLTFPQQANRSSASTTLTRDESGNVTYVESRCEGRACEAAEQHVRIAYEGRLRDTFCGAFWLPGVPPYDVYHGALMDL